MLSTWKMEYYAEGPGNRRLLRPCVKSGRLSYPLSEIPSFNVEVPGLLESDTSGFWVARPSWTACTINIRPQTCHYTAPRNGEAMSQIGN